MIFEVTPDKKIVWKYLNPAKIDLPPAPAPPLVEILPAFLRDTLKLSDEQTKQLDALEKQNEDKLLALLTDEQKKQLKSSPGGVGGLPTAPQAVQVLPAPVRQRLKLTDVQKKQLEALQKEAESKLDKALTADQHKQLKEVRSGFVNGWGGGGPPALGNAVFRSYRYPANYPGLVGKSLTSGKTIEELQPLEPEKK